MLPIRHEIRFGLAKIVHAFLGLLLAVGNRRPWMRPILAPMMHPLNCLSDWLLRPLKQRYLGE